jgi:DNA repair protein RadC
MTISSNHVVPISNLVESNLVISALRFLETKLRQASVLLSSARETIAFLQLHLADEKNEVFCALFLDSRNRLLAFEKLFFGTVNEAKVYPRVIIQKALEHNAVGVILAHNHPSGVCDPSLSDRDITYEIKKILRIIDVKLLDHMVVTYSNTFSFAENGLL